MEETTEELRKEVASEGPPTNPLQAANGQYVGTEEADAADP